MTIRSYTFGALYLGEVRRIHHLCGAEIKEQKGFLESNFYVSDQTAEGRIVIHNLDRFVRKLMELDRQEAEEERLEEERRRNHWFLKHFTS